MVSFKKGLAATRNYINSQKHNFDSGFNWRLMSISKETTNQLLNGKFKTLAQLDLFNEETIVNHKITMLYKISFNENKEDYEYFVETIFINE